MRITFVFWIYSNCSITKHCLWTCCCDFQIFIFTSYNRIFNMPEMTFLHLMFYFCIRNRCLTNWTPVYDTRTFVNPSFFI